MVKSDAKTDNQVVKSEVSMNFLWRLFWLFEAYMLAPLRYRKRQEHRYSLSVRLAIWTQQRQYYRLCRAIQIFWDIRNRWRYGPVDKFSSWWFNLTLPLRPKCQKHNYPLFSSWAQEICFMCALEEAKRKARLRELTGKT